MIRPAPISSVWKMGYNGGPRFCRLLWRVSRGSQDLTRSNAHGLTRREAQILDLLCDGLHNSAIASRLCVSTKTVDHHITAILGKLGVPSRAQAVAMARRKTE